MPWLRWIVPAVVGALGSAAIAASPLMTVAVAAGSLDHITIAPTSSTIVAPGTQSYRTEGFDQFGNDLGDVTASTWFAVMPDGTCSAATCSAFVAGPHIVTATDAGMTATASLTVIPGPAASIVLSPATATVAAAAGVGQTYQAEAYDSAGNDLGNVTASTTFFIYNGQQCDANSCWTTRAGSYTVYGVYQGVLGFASLTVIGAALDHMTIRQVGPSISAGGNQVFAVEGYDVFNNDLGDVTASAVLGITPDGTCSVGACTAIRAGPHTVTATEQGKSATVGFVVNPGLLDHLSLTPAAANVVAGTAQPYAVEGFDSYNNDIGNLTARTTFAITPDGACSSGVCSATAAGQHTVTATVQGVSAAAILTVNAGPLAAIIVSPLSATLAVQQSQIFTATGVDAYGNPVGVATPTWSIAGGKLGIVSPTSGTSVTFTASDSKTGNGSITATANGISGTAALTVVPAPPTNLAAAVKNTKVNLTWHGSAGAQAYAVYRGTSGSNLALIASGLIPTSFSDSPGVGAFFYYVVALSSTGAPSAPSNTISATLQ